MMDTAAPRKPSIWSYYLLTVAVVVVALGVFMWYASGRYRDFFVDHVQTLLEERATIISLSVQRLGERMPGWITADNAVTDTTCRIPGADGDIRIMVIVRDGTVLCDSQADKRTMDNHRNRPEIDGAFRGKVTTITRYSKTLDAELLYVAVPATISASDRYVVRAAMPLKSISLLLSQLKFTLFGIAVFVIIVSITFSIFIYRKINPPLRDIVLGAARFAEGRFERKLPTYDIQEISELSSTLNRMADQLRRLDTMRRDFVANVSHELKTPITSIKGFVATLRDGAKDDPQDLERFLEILTRQSDRLEAIVDDLLVLSRLESEPAPELLNLNLEQLDCLIYLVRELCSSRAQQNQIKIQVDCDTDLQINVDRSLMTQALVNLVDNAVNYSLSGSEVVIRARAHDKYIRIDVVDEGTGIAVEHLPRLFERFYRVDKARSRHLGGTGLGLAIVKHVVDIHNGAVSVDSELGKGSVFHIDLPRPVNE